MVYSCHLQLLAQYEINPVVRGYVDKIDWYFLVVANPDGYEFTHTDVSHYQITIFCRLKFACAIAGLTLDSKESYPVLLETPI